MLGIGDDAAVWQPSRSHRSVLTTDALVDGVHFESARMPAEAVGHRVLASNLSDIAAMGARPLLATIALGVPARADYDWILSSYRGLTALGTRFGCAVAGGDVVRAPALFYAVSVVGEVAPRALATRSGGRPGDVVAVTGPLGASRAGLELLRRPELLATVAPADAALATARFERPEPRLREGAWLAASAHVHAMMDLSDGLSTDLARLAAASGCGAAIGDVPVEAAAGRIAAAAGHAGEDYALDGGEDFELLVAVGGRAFRHLAGRFRTHFGRELRPVGVLRSGAGVTRSIPDGQRPLVPGGFRHLA